MKRVGSTFQKFSTLGPASNDFYVFSDFFKVTYLDELISYKLHIYAKVKLIILSITYVKIM